jgi:hypothetical protein
MEPEYSLPRSQETSTSPYPEPRASRPHLPPYFPKIHSNIKSRDSSIGIALGYVLDDRSSSVRFPAGAGNFSLYNRVQNGSGAHPAPYPMGTRGSFLGGKAAGAWSWPLTSI